MRPYAAVSDFQPGIWSLLVVALLLGLAVWMALRQRRLNEASVESLAPSNWKIEALPPQRPADRRILAVNSDALVLASPKSGTQQNWPWAEVEGVSVVQLRSRLRNYPGVRISFTGGHSEEFLVPEGHTRSAYADGATQTYRRITQHLAPESGAQSAGPSG